MWDQILSLALGNGLWAVLFLFLFLYELKDSSKRETKYQATIGSLCESLEIVKDIKEDSSKILTAVNS